MKTTIEIPELLYKKAKIRAIEDGKTLRQIVLNALERDLCSPSSGQSLPSWGKRRLLSDYSRFEAEGAYNVQERHTDITELISDERDAR